MSFVFEMITEEDSKEADWEKYKEYQDSWKAHPDAWIIDREHDVYMWRVNGRVPEWPNEVYGLYWKGNGFGRIELIENLKGTEVKPVCDAFFEILRVSLPSSLEESRAEINEAIAEAFEAFARRRGTVRDFSIYFR